MTASRPPLCRMIIKADIAKGEGVYLAVDPEDSGDTFFGALEGNKTVSPAIEQAFLEIKNALDREDSGASQSCREKAEAVRKGLTQLVDRIHR